MHPTESQNPIENLHLNRVLVFTFFISQTTSFFYGSINTDSGTWINYNYFVSQRNITEKEVVEEILREKRRTRSSKTFFGALCRSDVWKQEENNVEAGEGANDPDKL